VKSEEVKIPRFRVGFLELLTRIELVTSSLPKNFDLSVGDVGGWETFQKHNGSLLFGRSVFTERMFFSVNQTAFLGRNGSIHLFNCQGLFWDSAVQCKMM